MLYVDNFYTYPRLAQYMLQHQTHVVGTIRPNITDCAHDLQDEQINKRSAAACKAPNEHVMVVKYRAHKDKAGGKPKIVCSHVLSTTHADTIM